MLNVSLEHSFDLCALRLVETFRRIETLFSFQRVFKKLQLQVINKNVCYLYSYE